MAILRTALKCQPQTSSKSRKQVNPGEASAPQGNGGTIGWPVSLPGFHQANLCSASGSVSSPCRGKQGRMRGTVTAELRHRDKDKPYSRD